jgi:hypothetical protein
MLKYGRYSPDNVTVFTQGLPRMRCRPEKMLKKGMAARQSDHCPGTFSKPGGRSLRARFPINN